MLSPSHPRRTLTRAVVLAVLLVMAVASYRLAAQQPSLSFETVEGDVWQQLAPVGRGLDAFQHPITTDPSVSDPTGYTWPCDTENGFVHLCYPSGTVGIGAGVFPAPLQLQGRFVPCDAGT